jgi:hypothetical protein
MTLATFRGSDESLAQPWAFYRVDPMASVGSDRVVIVIL